VLAFGPVAGSEAGEPVALHGAGEALAAGDADPRGVLAGGEQGRLELLAGLVVRGVVGAELDDVAARLVAVRGEVALHGLGQAPVAAAARLGEGDLHGAVPIALDRLHL